MEKAASKSNRLSEVLVLLFVVLAAALIVADMAMNVTAEVGEPDAGGQVVEMAPETEPEAEEPGSDYEYEPPAQDEIIDA